MLAKSAIPLKISATLAAAVLLAASCKRADSNNSNKANKTGRSEMNQMQLTSTAFNDGKMIPKKYTCDGENVSPPLSWEGVPEGTQSLALIADDPDAPAGTWVHWVVYNIPPAVQKLTEDIPPLKKAENGLTQGVNDFKKIGYGGPCPPSGTHRYFFKLYACSEELSLGPGATKQELLDALNGKVLGEAELVGKYSR